MLENIIFLLTFISMLLCGIEGGLFFAFSSFVMKALSRISPEAGITAMQSIDASVYSPLFMAAFVGAPLFCILATITSLLSWRSPATTLVITASVVYLAGSLLVTVAFNIPLNNLLDAVVPSDPNAAAFWTRYLSEWTFWNHVRTVASLAAMALFVFALIHRTAK